ncbi:MAG TPA: TlpA disulfide reductase family protein [Myxococcales bacterium]|jgi:thiol-disulfide isomerase/thioredoxin
MHRLLATCVAALLTLPAGAVAAEAGDEELPGEGAEAPGFTLPTYNAEAAAQPRAGTMLLVGDDSEDTGAKVILVSFMASYCKPCKKELPWLQKMHEAYKGNGLRIIGVAIDSEAEGQKAVGELLKEEKVSFPVVKDQFNFVARRYLGNKVPLPSVFLVDKAGKIGFVSRGYSSEISKTLTEAIQKKLGVPLTPMVHEEPAKAPEPAAAAPADPTKPADGKKPAPKSTKKESKK